MKEFICDSCANSEQDKQEFYTPIYASSCRVKKVTKFITWCRVKSSYVHKLKTYKDAKNCGYRLKAGKVNKHLYQKMLGEN